MRLLHNNCLSCHNAEKQKGGLQLTTRERALEGGESGAVLAGTPEESLIFKVLAPDADPHMPPKKQLAPDQIELVRQWIAAGANWNPEALAQAATPREVQLEKPPANYQPVFAVAVTLDGTRLAFSRGQRILVHDLTATNQPVLADFEAHQDAVRALAWNSEGTLLASGSYRQMTLWNGSDLSRKFSIDSVVQGRVTALRFSPYGGALILADSPPSGPAWIRILSPDDGTILAEWEAHPDTINDLSVSSEGGLLATAGTDKVIRLWELVSRREAGRYEGHTGAVLGAAFGTNATELVTVSADKQLLAWDVKTRQSVVTIGPKPHGFNAVAWSQDGATVIAADDAGGVTRYRDFKRHTGAQSSSTANEKLLRRWTQPVHALALNADASRIYAGDADGVLRIIDGEGKELGAWQPSKPDEAAEKITAAPDDIPSFVRDVLPMLAKAGCNAGGCHAKPDGQNGFKLSVFSYDPKSDYDEIVHEGRGRRIFPAAPSESLILLKPTMAVDHGGGQRIQPDSETCETLIRWIRGGMPYQRTNEPALVRISVEPTDSTYSPSSTVQLKVLAHYSDDSLREVTALADYVSNEKEIAAVDELGLVQVGRLSGESVIVARYMGFVDASRITVPSEKTLPDEKFASLPKNNFIDRLAFARFQKLGLFPSGLSSDAEFLRRASLDVLGRLPSPAEARQFLNDSDPGKRGKWIDRLLRHPAYADYWANKWADLLRPNPDRVGIKSVYLLDQWLRETFRENKRYDQFVREIIAAEGSNHREGPLTIYRDRRDPPERTTMFSQLFLGVRMECAKCHHHPNEKWSQDDFYQLAAFFAPVKQKGAGLSPPISAGTETFYFAAGGSVKHPITGAVMQPRPLDGGPLAISEKEDPRDALADWLIDPANPFFAKAAVNRVWAAFFGRGFVEPVDDFRVSNPAVHEPLLSALAQDFVNHGYDLKHLMRTILSSRLYQLSSTPNEYNLADTKNFSRSYRRRLPAEVLLDAVDDITGIRSEFDGCPPGTRAMQTWSYKIDSHFMDAFGRPDSSSDAPCERDLRTSVVQSLHMMNSKLLQDKLAHAEGQVKQWASSAMSHEEIIEEMYLRLYSRLPTTEELETALEVYSVTGADRQTATEDLLWALLNSATFVFNH